MEAEIKIEKGVPIPPRSHGSRGRCVYPWAALEHGDSFLVPYGDTSQAKMRSRISVLARKWLNRNKPEWTYTARGQADGIRVWFIDPSANGAA